MDNVRQEWELEFIKSIQERQEIKKETITIQEVTKLLTLTKFAYPYFYKDITDEDVEFTEKIWMAGLRDLEMVYVNRALGELIKTEEFPPTIAKLRNKALEIEKAIYLKGLENTTKLESKPIVMTQEEYLENIQKLKDVANSEFIKSL